MSVEHNGKDVQLIDLAHRLVPEITFTKQEAPRRVQLVIAILQSFTLPCVSCQSWVVRTKHQGQS